MNGARRLLSRDTELVLYRVAQEGLTNAVRHSGADRVDLTLTLTHTSAGVVLSVSDDGNGIHDAPEGAGISGMRERALLVGADLSLGPGPERGTEVRLVVPTHHESD